MNAAAGVVNIYASDGRLQDANYRVAFDVKGAAVKDRSTKQGIEEQCVGLKRGRLRRREQGNANSDLTKTGNFCDCKPCNPLLTRVESMARGTRSGWDEGQAGCGSLSDFDDARFPCDACH